MNLFKQEGKKPYTYSSIEMRKSSRSYLWWIAGIIVITLILAVFFWIS